ncbi:MAG: hypothetical protein EHM25_14680, partial [Nitrosopumilales archaeon]
EIWKDIEDYEDYYEISSLGRFRSKTRTIINKNGKKFLYHSRIIEPRLDKYGYLRVQLNKNNKAIYRTVHRLVAIHFIPNPNNYPQVNHIDGIKINNAVSNLEWCTVYDNLNHSYSSGLKQIKLSKQDVSNIREMYKLGDCTQKEIGVIFNVSKEHVNGIINNKKRINI